MSIKFDPATKKFKVAEPTPKKAKDMKLPYQYGLHKVTIRDSSDVGCSKVMEAWVQESAWNSRGGSILEGLLDVCASTLGRERSSLYVEV